MKQVIIEEQILDFLSKVGIDLSGKKHSKNNTMIRCPFAKVNRVGGHADGYDTKPSMGLKINKYGFIYNCFTCGEKGSSLIQFIDNLKKNNLLAQNISAYELQNRFSFEFPEYDSIFETDDEEERVVDISNLRFGKTKKYFEHLKHKRGLRLSTADKLGIRYAINTKQIVFNCYDRKKNIVGYVFYSLEQSKYTPKYYNEVDRENLLYLEWLIKGKRIIVVEGMFDAPKIYQHLLDLNLLDKYSVVGTYGAGISEGQIKKLVKYATSVFVMGDNDEGGIKLEKSIYYRIRKKIPLVFSIQYSAHDPGELSLKDFETSLKGAVLYGTNAIDKKY